MLKLTELQVSSRNHPIGLDEQPVFSWKMVSDIPDTIQTAYRVRVGSWDTGRVESGDSLFVPYAGPALQPRTAYRVQVEVWDNHGQTACAETGVETGLRGPDGFAAQWIADPFEGEHPLPVFETEFAIDTPVTTARLYIMAHGIYEAELDGAKLGDAWFAPGWTSYHKRLQDQTIPVDTARLTPGRHTLHVTVANGWYKGALGFVPRPNHYGDRAALLAMLCLDGRTVATGEGWRVTTGPVQRAEFYYGEDYDAAAAAAALQPHCPHVFLLSGQGSAKEKRALLDDLAAVPAREPLAIVAIGKYAGEGFDLPRLDALLLTMPVVWKGTLTQYTGRLHRVVPGKQQVLLYDFVDLRVPMLEQQYRRRLRNYAALAYTVRSSTTISNLDEHITQKEAATFISHEQFLSWFAEDLKVAAREVLLCVPSLSARSVQRVIPLLQHVQHQGGNVQIYLPEPALFRADIQPKIAANTTTLQQAGVPVVFCPSMVPNFCVIDQRLVWYGTLNPLGRMPDGESSLRMEAPDVAAELAEFLRGKLEGV